MATGISASNIGPTIGGDPIASLHLIEARVLSNLFQTSLGSAVLDNLDLLRNDQAFELGIPMPVPGTGK